MLVIEKGRAMLQPGDRFGRLVIQGGGLCDAYGASRWECLCDCGNKKLVTGGDLRRGFVKSCGCLKRDLFRERALARGEDLSGRRFGGLLVKRRVNSPNPAATMWECLCDCGETANCYGSNLRGGRNKSCGCRNAKSKGLGKTSSAIVGSLVAIPNQAHVKSLRTASVLSAEYKSARRDASVATLRTALKRMHGKTRIQWTKDRLHQLEQAIAHPESVIKQKN